MNRLIENQRYTFVSKNGTKGACLETGNKTKIEN